VSDILERQAILFNTVLSSSKVKTGLVV